jgi:2-succinyl-6-hydroxy-2,4-cyclohexadiene-1-carboxylate synthase
VGSGCCCSGQHLTSAALHRDIDVGDGLTLHAAVSGSGPALILLHGFTGSGETWSSLRSALDDRFTVVTVDLPGHGRSSAPEDPARYAVDRFVGDLAHVFDELQLPRANVLGYSMGGRMALRFALAHPDRVSALILESTSPGIVDSAERDQRNEADQKLADLADQQGITGFVNHWESLSLWASQSSVPPDKRAELRAQRLSGNARGLANSLRGAGAARAGPVSGRLNEITVPVLLLAGSLDDAYIRHAEAMQERLPSARLEIIADAGHAAHFERPDRVAAAVRSFLLDSVSQHTQHLKENS